MATKSEFIAALRDFADRLEASPVGETSANFSSSVGAHWVKGRGDLAALARLMNRPDAWHRNGIHAVSDHRDEVVQLTAYYEAGMLGPTRKETVKVVEVEDTPDIAELLACDTA